MRQDELQLLRRKTRRLTVAGLLLILVLPALGVVSYLVLRGQPLLGPDGEVAQPAWAAALCVSHLGSVAAVILGWKTLRRAMAYKKACARGEVHQYAGQYVEVEETPPWMECLRDKGVLNLTPGAENQIEVLPDGQILYHVNGMMVGKWIEVDTGLVANTPPASISTTRLDTVSLSADGETVGRRELSPAERTELGEYFGREPEAPLVSWIRDLAPGLFVGIMVFTVCRKLTGWSMLTDIAVGVVAALIVIPWILIGFRGVRDEQEGDMNAGYVKVSSEVDEATGKARVIERLPLSGEEWTIDGRPAPWRGI